MRYRLSQALVLGSMKNHKITKVVTRMNPTSRNQRTFTPALQDMTTKIKVYTTHMPMSPHTAAMRASINRVWPPIWITEGMEPMSRPSC